MKLPNNKFKIKNLKLKIVAIFFFTFYILGFIFSTASAQELQRTFTLINPSIEQAVNPGGHAEGTTKIINEGNTTLTFKAGVQDFIVTDNIGTPQILPPNTLSNKYSAASWIGVTPSQFTVEPGHSQVVNYYIQTPLTASPGGHYAAIVYEPLTSTLDSGTGGTVRTQIGSLFYVTINGPVKESASVSKFFANSFSEYGPVKINTEIKNMGGLHISPKATITVSGLFYNTKQDLVAHNIFPETVREFENSVGNTFMLGRYKAELFGTYGKNNNLPLVATLYFWVFPWKLALLLVLIIVAVVLGTSYYKKRKKSSPKSSSEPKDTSKVDEEAQNSTETA